MRETGAVYVRSGNVEVTLGPAPVQFEEEKAQFKHDDEDPAEAGRVNRKNPLLSHPALRR